jgi:hypothetical protein
VISSKPYPRAATSILKNIIHDWNDERSIAILGVCRKAMRGESKILIVEGVVPAGNIRSPTKIMDINMLVVTGGRERTEAEHRALLAAAGLRLSRSIPVTASTPEKCEIDQSRTSCTLEAVNLERRFRRQCW